MRRRQVEDLRVALAGGYAEELRGPAARLDAALAHAPLGAQVAERVVALSLTDPPAETTH